MADKLHTKAGWEIQAKTERRTLYSLLECVAEIASEFDGLLTAQQSHGPGASLPTALAAARKISVSIRKMLLDGNGKLLTRCVASPKFHPLMIANNVAPVMVTKHYEDTEGSLKKKPGMGDDVHFTVPAMSHIVTMHPLPGITHIKDHFFQLHDPFDYDAQPIKFKKWMNTRILEIDGRQFRVEQILREMTNKEGAHIEYNPATLNPKLTTTDTPNLHQECDWVRFGNLSYLQIFTIFTGAYIVNRLKPALMTLPIVHDDAVQYLCTTISRSPTILTLDDATLQISNKLALVFGDDNKLVDGYGVDKQTIFKTPQP